MEDELMLDSRQENDDEHKEQKIINEEYKIWKKNSIFLYDIMVSRALSWPTLSTQWFPDMKALPGTNSSTHRILYGTHTSNEAQNFLTIATIDIPNSTPPDPAQLNPNTGEVGGHGAAKKQFDFKVIQEINHPGEVNKARYMPSNPNMIASLAVDGRVLIFDRAKHTSKPPPEGDIKFEMELVGHSKEGYGLSWNPRVEGSLATGNEDMTVKTWDIKGGYTQSSKTIHAVSTYSHHSSTVNDVQYHPKLEFWIASVSDDRTLQIIDTRKQGSKKIAFKKDDAHTDAINCVAWHPNFDHIVTTGSADNSIGIWDLRCLDEKLHSLEAHRDSVVSLEWHPNNDAIVASSSYDRRINIWDVSRIGDEQTPEEAEDGPPELLFMHGGFTNRISDFSWNKNEPWVMLAAAEDNQMHIFKPARTLVNVYRNKVAHNEVSD